LNGALVAGTVDNSAHTVAVTLPYGSTLTRYPTFVLANGATAKVGGVAQVSGSTTNNYSSPVTYVITAQDNTATQEYVVTLTIALNADATFTSFAFNGLTPALVEGPGGKVAISNTWNTITVIFLPGTNRTSLVPTFTLATGATLKVGGTSQTSEVTANNYSSNLTYDVTAQYGTTTKTYRVIVGSAALSTESKIKGQTPLIVGTPSTDSSAAAGGSISISLVQAANISNAGSYVTLFSAIDTGDEVMRAVKYAAGADYTGFETATVYANSAITSGDFFIVKVKSASTITILYYKIVVTVEYNIGDTGPGGGIVFYKDLSTGFNCGATFSNIGSPTGGLCHYLEVAPLTWSDSSATFDPTLPWAISPNLTTSVPGVSEVDNWPENILKPGDIGLGLSNSIAVVTQNGSCATIALCGYAAGAARIYQANALSDWYLPTAMEMHLLCQWVVGGTPSKSSKCTGGPVVNGGFSSGNSPYSTSSPGSGAGILASYITKELVAGTGTGLYVNKADYYSVRPIRSF
jgi:hypothetical protein